MGQAIRISRHARGRMKLYGITVADVTATLEYPDTTENQGDATALIKAFPGKYSGYPLKVVYERQGDALVVITAYPLKKKAWR
jgi:hypothetical protein